MRRHRATLRFIFTLAAIAAVAGTLATVTHAASFRSGNVTPAGMYDGA